MEKVEEKIREKLACKLDIFDKDLSLIKQEAFLRNRKGTRGFVDLLARDSLNRYVLIELKRSKAASREAIHEIFKYIEGIKENKIFSVNFPNPELAIKTDYCGLVSGRDVDKSKVFNLFFGESQNAPMIQECPICVECSVHQLVDLPDHVVVFGEVQHIYTEEQYLTDGHLDPKKFNPLVFIMHDFNGIENRLNFATYILAIETLCKRFDIYLNTIKNFQ